MNAISECNKCIQHQYVQIISVASVCSILHCSLGLTIAAHLRSISATLNAYYQNSALRRITTSAHHTFCLFITPSANTSTSNPELTSISSYTPVPHFNASHPFFHFFFFNFFCFSIFLFLKQPPLLTDTVKDM